jgi:hypothetical protein
MVNVESKEVTKLEKMLNGCVNCLTIAKKGQFLFAGYKEGVVVEYNTVNARFTIVVDTIKAAVTKIFVSNNSKWLFVCDDESNLYQYGLTDHANIGNYGEIHRGHVKDLA